ncbi:MAG: putative toxin-antitoxin system toxin component, PIN family [Candidatus Beckwithbacteria bacterium]|nr:putative toxin-antitoxin system toxin component, PIN family [Patescibacteria group bacterium]
MNSSTKLRVVLDTNIFISGFYWGGIPKKIFNLWLKNKFTLYISPHTLAELIIVLIRFNLPKKEIINLKSLIEKHSKKVLPTKKIKVCRDPKDNKFLEVCVASSADYLVTGDKDLLTLKEYKNTQIVNPKQFLKLL